MIFIPNPENNYAVYIRFFIRNRIDLNLIFEEGKLFKAALFFAFFYSLFWKIQEESSGIVKTLI